MKSIYLSGPMTGLPESNYPAFNAEAERLRALGYRVENPAENPAPHCGSWAGYMRYAIAQMMTCDVVAHLPGWMESRGAALEHFVARKLDIECVPVSVIAAPYEEQNPLPTSGGSHGEGR